MMDYSLHLGDARCNHAQALCAGLESYANANHQQKLRSETNQAFCTTRYTWADSLYMSTHVHTRDVHAHRI